MAAVGQTQALIDDLAIGWCRLGFRMPARREQSTQARAESRRPKASEERTRGTAASSRPAMGICSRRGVG